MSSDEQLQQKLIRNFKIENTDFYDLIEFRPGEVGFSVKRKYKDSEAISLLKVGILKGSESNKKPLYVGATFGTLNANKDAVALRIGRKKTWKEPIDLESKDDYYYDVAKNKLFKNDKPIEGIALLKDFYKVHLASRKTLKGLVIRLRLDFWQLLARLFMFISKTLGLLLRFVSGTQFSYDPFLAGFEDSESLSGRQKPEPEIKESSKIDFLGYSASKWAVLFYCILHLSVYAVFIFANLRIEIITVLIKNNFLTVAYVIVSLWLIESAFPQLLKLGIRQTSEVSFNLQYRKVNINI